MPKHSGNGDNDSDSLNSSDRDSIFAKFKGFDFDKFLNLNKIPITIALLGLIMLGLGVFLFKNTNLFKEDSIEIIDEPTISQDTAPLIVVEIAGSVVRPGVYKFKNGDRVEDLMTACGGLSADADRIWVEKYINRAAKLSDGLKIYVKSGDESTESVSDKQIVSTTAKSNGGYQSASPVLGVDNSDLLNINTASFEELDKLPGIGRVYGQKIIEQRPYSDLQELLSRSILPKSTFEKIKDKISVY